jgi:hypothetical protein
MPWAIHPKVNSRIWGRIWPRARVTVKAVVVKAVWDSKEVSAAALEGCNLAPKKAAVTGGPSTTPSQEAKMRVDTISASTRNLNITATNPSSLAGKPCSSLTARHPAPLSPGSVSYHYYVYNSEQGAVGIATGYGMGGRGSIPDKSNIHLFTSNLVVQPTIYITGKSKVKLSP